MLMGERNQCGNTNNQPLLVDCKATPTTEQPALDIALRRIEIESDYVAAPPDDQ